MAAAEGEAGAVVAAEAVAVEVVEREEAAAAVQALEEVLVAEKGRQVALEAAQVRGAQAPSTAGAFREVSRLGVLASRRLQLYLLDRCLVGERWVEV